MVSTASRGFDVIGHPGEGRQQVQRPGTTRVFARLLAATLALALLAALTLHVRPALADFVPDHPPVAAAADAYGGDAPSVTGTSGRCAAPSLCWSLPAEQSVSVLTAPARPRLPHLARMLVARSVSPPAMPPRSLA